ncbi:type II toxin-antitoxin system RatA family toxin [Thalassotalea sp. LPB0316]|uniref:type II toxin-antitoxin system RatA family toxin n=1 Tax=Thalassotalea sp. LPB0316 TaxID=2769490 RepID=UPI001868011D|nr:type II toxin-antitoxin system RatA family toxin [Thalassotalea sp. LPB0316]QOL25297.1 type II toxin-antitoxin system RatA family toxin [Thalassotalea sp. LPB0316]
MPTINRSALVMHSVEQMFTLINDVLNYPLFVPDCADSKIIEQDDNSMTASLLVSKGGVKKWFTTHNTYTKNETVTLELVDGPFKYLKGAWQLTPLSDDACKIDFVIDYEFSSKVFDFAFGKVFNHITNNMVQAFTKRAKEVYS